VDPGELSRLATQKLRLHKVGGDERLLETKYGMEQEVEGLDPDAVKQTLQEMAEYMIGDVHSNPQLKDVVCKNRQRDCLRKKLGSEGACSSASMTTLCAPLCQSCHFLDFNHRCPLDDSVSDAVAPGFLNEMFERIITDKTYQQQYTPIIISKPSYYDAATVTKSEEFGNVTDADGPWVVVLDNFLSQKECKHMQKMGYDQGYAQSADVGAADFTGKTTSNFNDGRTSQNAWCMGKCAKDATAQDISKRMVQLTGIPDPNHEFLQLLKYDVGQHYGRHHDYADYHLKRQYGPRVLTVFLYLNTVEEGGGTHFSALNLTVVPKEGRAVIWPSVLSEKPRDKDARTDHEALPVEKGIKFGANAWIHQRDFKEEHRKSCI
jgi:prolyl 4-hydroxylase